MANHTQPSSTLSVHTVEDTAAYLKYFESNKDGIALVPEPYGETPLGLKADGVDFAKWIKQTTPEFSISLPSSSPKIALHSGDIWLPLIYLAGDTSMSVLLNMVSNYFYDRIKGNLLSDRPKVHMTVVYQNKRDGITKKFEFSGDSDSLKKAVKRFDLDNFFNESSE
ncbi:hypothetical protein [Burkholderia sp. LMU1-1-1.1]|uniref:hypothetical protein n=1 Tax=Burkholderia sp. LMU1-1-1.1 TaxID=3135266 RepID=UPI0034327F05